MKMRRKQVHKNNSTANVSMGDRGITEKNRASSLRTCSMMSEHLPWNSQSAECSARFLLVTEHIRRRGHWYPLHGKQHGYAPAHYPPGQLHEIKIVTWSVSPKMRAVNMIQTQQQQHQQQQQQYRSTALSSGPTA